MARPEIGIRVLRDPSPKRTGYEPPSITVLGAVHLLTQTDKKFGPTDGYTFGGIAITNASP